jgi:osmotically-inducible protein OsmY
MTPGPYAAAIATWRERSSPAPPHRTKTVAESALPQPPARGHVTHSRRQKENQMDLTDNRVMDDVRTELAADPRLPYPEEIAVEAYGDTVTLRGTIGSFAQQRAAVADARRTRGVLDVYDELDVRILDRDRREDAEIRGAALQRMSWDTQIPGDYLDVRVKDGWVTLTGDVDFQFQSDLAFDDASRMRGVTGVTNKIKVVERL